MKELFHNNRISKFILIFIALIILINFNSCKKKEEPETIKIGAILPLTGSGALWGQNAQKGIKLALEQLNRNGGINGKKVEVIFEDSKSVPNEAVSAFRKLIDIDKIQCSIVDMISSNVLALAPIAEQKKVVIISPGASSPDITNAGEYTFRNWPSDAFQGEELAKFVFTKKNIKKVAILYIENSFGESLKKVFTATFENLGGNVVLSEPFKQGSVDFRPQVAKVKSSNPEGIVLFTYPVEALKLVKQIKSANINAQLFATAEIEDPTVLTESSFEGLIYAFPKPADRNQKEVADFISAYKSKYNEEPGIVADVAYDAFNILCKAIREVGYNGPKIKDALLNIKDYHGAAGITTFDKNGDVIKPFIFKVIKNGKFQPFE